MPKPFRLASFNVENLFSRARVLNLPNHEETDRLLKKITALKHLLVKATYSTADKQAIAALLMEDTNQSPSQLAHQSAFCLSRILAAAF